MGDSIVELTLTLKKEGLTLVIRDGEEKKVDKAPIKLDWAPSIETFTLKLPIVHRKDSSESVFETMSIASVVEHNGILYKLRMPNAKHYVDENIRVTINNASEKESDLSFNHEIAHTLNYRRIALEKSDKNSVNEKYLDPTYFTEEKHRRTAYNMTSEDSTIFLESSTGEGEDNITKGFKNIALDCFAIELGGSSHYLIYIAGKWFISFTNFFKFFSEDYRRRNINDIVAKIKSMRKSFSVKQDKVDDLLMEVYPIWSGFNERRRQLIGNLEYYTRENIKDIIVKHMQYAYPESQYGRGNDSGFQNIQKNILKSVDSVFLKYVSLHPHWNTKEQFDSFFGAMDLVPGDYYRSLKTQPTLNKSDEIQDDEDSSVSDSDSDDFEDESESAPPTVPPSQIDPDQIAFNEVTFDKIKNLVNNPEKIHAHMTSYALEILEKLNIIEEDRIEIVKQFLGETVDIDKDLTAEGLQRAMQTRANNELGKFGLFVKLAEIAGVKQDDTKPELVREQLQKKLKELQDEIKSMGEQIKNYNQFLTPKNPGSNTIDQGKAADQQPSGYTPEEADRLIKELDEGLKKKPKEIGKLKREIHAMNNDEWVKLRHVLERAGVKATNKASSKKNAVFTLKEFDDMLNMFSGISNPSNLNNEKKNLQAKLLNIDAKLNSVSEDVIDKKIKELEAEFDETYVNFGIPKKPNTNLDYFPRKGFPYSVETAVDAQNVNSKKLFRGNKGTKLDNAIKYWMGSYGKGYKFFWSNKQYRTYGETSSYVIRNKDGQLVDNTAEPRTVSINLALARENPLIETYYTLLHELGHVNTPHADVKDDPATWTHHRNQDPKVDLKNWSFLKEKAAAGHDKRWKKNATQLYRKFEEENNKKKREPRQYCTNVAWHKVKRVKRLKRTRTIVSKEYPGETLRLGKKNKDYEIVAYNPKDYDVTDYKYIDPDNLVKKQKERKKELIASIALLKAFKTNKATLDHEQTRKLHLLVGNNDIADDREEIVVRIGEIDTEIAKLKDRQAVEYIEDPNHVIFIKMAKYIRGKVRSSENVTGMVQDICRLYSAGSGETDFKLEMGKIINDTSVEDDSDWVNSSGDIRSVHNYIEALVSIRYISDGSTDELLDARSNERFNGIPMALRYAMYIDGVPLNLLSNRTFEKLSLFGKKINRQLVTIDDMFPKRGTKQKGLYEAVMVDGKVVETNPPQDTTGYKSFHKIATKALEMDSTWYSKRKVDNPKKKKKTKKSKSKPKGKTNNRSRIELYVELPNFLSMTMAAINANMRTQPQVIPRQSAAECGVHAVNNLLQSDYTLENFQRVQGTSQWFTDTTLGVILGNPGILAVDGRRWVGRNENRTLSLNYSMNYFERYADVFMDNENLVGFIFFLGPNEAGHWTSVKKWDTDRFTYMDSFKHAESGDGGLVVTLPKREMITYIMTRATYSGVTATAFFAVYKDVQTFNAARLNIESLDADYGAPTSPTGSSPGGSNDNPDAESDDSLPSDKDLPQDFFNSDAEDDPVETVKLQEPLVPDNIKEDLIKYAMENKKLKSTDDRREFWNVLQKKIYSTLNELANKHNADPSELLKEYMKREEKIKIKFIMKVIKKLNNGVLYTDTSV